MVVSNMLNRSKMLQEIERLLISEGYKTSDIYDQGSFDIVARKNLLILLLKTFINIDSVNEKNAHEMKQLANIFLASPIIIGAKGIPAGRSAVAVPKMLSVKLIHKAIIKEIFKPTAFIWAGFGP